MVGDAIAQKLDTFQTGVDRVARGPGVGDGGAQLPGQPKRVVVSLACEINPESEGHFSDDFALLGGAGGRPDLGLGVIDLFAPIAREGRSHTSLLRSSSR